MKRLTALLITAVLLVSIFAVSVFAAQTEKVMTAQGDDIMEGDVDGDDGPYIPSTVKPTEVGGDPTEPPEEHPACLLGDADGDGQVTVLDATAIQRNLVKLPTESFIEKPADADENGKIEILDATAIQRWLVKLSTHEGIGEKYV